MWQSVHARSGCIQQGAERRPSKGDQVQLRRVLPYPRPSIRHKGQACAGGWPPPPILKKQRDSASKTKLRGQQTKTDGCWGSHKASGGEWAACRLPRRSPPIGAGAVHGLGCAVPSWQVDSQLTANAVQPNHTPPSPRSSGRGRMRSGGPICAAVRLASKAAALLHWSWFHRSWLHWRGGPPHSSRLGRCAAAAHSRSMSFWR